MFYTQILLVILSTGAQTSVITKTNRITMVAEAEPNEPEGAYKNLGTPGKELERYKKEHPSEQNEPEGAYKNLGTPGKELERYKKEHPQADDKPQEEYKDGSTPNREYERNSQKQLERNETPEPPVRRYDSYDQEERTNCLETVDINWRKSNGTEYFQPEPDDSRSPGNYHVVSSSGFFTFNLNCRKRSWDVVDPSLELGAEYSSFPKLGLTKNWNEEKWTQQYRISGIQTWHVSNVYWLTFPTNFGLAINNKQSTHKVEPMLGGGMLMRGKYLGLQLKTEAYSTRALMFEGSISWQQLKFVRFKGPDSACMTNMFNKMSFKAFYQHWLGDKYQFQTVYNEYGLRSAYTLSDYVDGMDFYLTISKTMFNANVFVLGATYFTK